LKYILFAFILISCQSSDRHEKAEEAIGLAIRNKDTALAKKLASDELKRLRSSITDSVFGKMTDVMLLIQDLEFSLQQADTSRRVADEIIVNHPDGRRLYDLMMYSYKLGLASTSRSDDTTNFTNKTSIGQQEWLKQNFTGKTNTEAKKSLLRLQKDIALISAIVNHLDSGETRKEIEDSYKDL
jgi:hypothetical protein